MRAALLRELPAIDLELADIAEPAPARDDEVVVNVEACGICGTDLHILAGEAYRPELPFVLGHEPVGRVADAGAEAQPWLGRRVTMTLFEGCGSCACCLAGDERLCPNLRSILGVSRRPGGFAERLSVPAAQLVAVPDELSSTRAASLVDAGVTAMNATRVAVALERRLIAVVGGGPVGLLVADLMALEGRAAVVAEPNAHRRELLLARGHAVADGVSALTGDFDCVIDCSGSAGVPAWAIERLAPRGLLVLAGYAAVPSLDFAPVARKELTIRGIRSGSRDDLERVLALVSEQSVEAPPTHCWALEEVNGALSALRRGAVEGKAIIEPDHSASRQEAKRQWTSS